MDTQANVLERAGSPLHFWINGPADGPLVVFTHGATLDHEMFAPQRDALVAAGYRVLTWDARSRPVDADGHAVHPRNRRGRPHRHPRRPRRSGMPALPAA